MNEFLVLLQAKLDEVKSKGLINSDITSLQSRLDKLKLQVEIDPNTAQKLANDIGKLINQQITISNINIDTNQVIRNAQQTGQQIGRQIQSGINSVIQKGDFKTEFTFSADKQNNVAKVAQEEFKKIANGIVTIKEQMNQVDGKSFLDGFIVNIKKANGEIESLTYRLKDMLDSQGKSTGKSFQYVGGSINDNGVIKQLDAISTKADNLQTKLDKLKANYSDINSSRPIKDSNNISALSQQYDKVSQAIENVRNADNTTFSSMVSNAQREITALESMVAQFRNAENVATQMKSVDISSGIAQAQERLGKLKADSTGFEQMTQTLRELDTAITNVGDKSSLDAFIDKLRVAETQLSRVKAEAKQLSQIHEIQLSMDTGETESKVEALIAKTSQWTDTEGKARINTQSLTDALNALDRASNAYLKVPTEEKQKALIEANEQLSIEYKKIASEVRSMNAEFAKDSAVDALRLQYQNFYSENGKAHKKFGEQLKSAMSELSRGAEVPKQRVEELKKELINTKAICKELGLTGQTWFQDLGDKIKQLTTYLSGTFIIGKVLQNGKQMIDNVSKLDVSLVELEKVSDLTSDGLEKVTDQSYKLGKSLAKTGTDVIDSVTSFKRAGYDIADSMKYAEEALKTTNISENLKDAGQAADNLVNIMKGFRNESPEFAKKINDAVNQVSNTEAVDFDNLIDGATRLSAVAEQAGMSFEQMLGTLTGGYEILGNMEKVATGQITIFSRLQAIQLDGEEEVSTVAKLQETFNNATKGAVNIVDQTTGQLRNVYNILDDVANVWDKLDKNTREALAIESAGIRQKNVFLAMMQNWKGVKDAVESASNSVGSADVENEKYITSIQGRVEDFERSVQQLSRIVLDSDVVKWFVDLETTGINALDAVIDKLGTLGTIGLGTGIITFVKSFA